MREEQQKVGRLIRVDCRRDLSWVTSKSAAGGDHSLLQALQHSHSSPFSWTYAEMWNKLTLQPSDKTNTNSHRKKEHASLKMRIMTQNKHQGVYLGNLSYLCKHTYKDKIRWNNHCGQLIRMYRPWWELFETIFLFSGKQLPQELCSKSHFSVSACFHLHYRVGTGTTRYAMFPRARLVPERRQSYSRKPYS